MLFSMQVVASSELPLARGLIAAFVGVYARDAVGVVSIPYSDAPGPLFARGSTQVTATARDAASDHSSRSFWVCVY